MALMLILGLVLDRRLGRAGPAVVRARTCRAAGGRSTRSPPTGSDSARRPPRSQPTCARCSRSSRRRRARKRSPASTACERASEACASCSTRRACTGRRCRRSSARGSWPRCLVRRLFSCSSLTGSLDLRLLIGAGLLSLMGWCLPYVRVQRRARLRRRADRPRGARARRPARDDGRGRSRLRGCPPARLAQHRRPARPGAAARAPRAEPRADAGGGASEHVPAGGQPGDAGVHAGARAGGVARRLDRSDPAQTWRSTCGSGGGRRRRSARRRRRRRSSSR